MKVAITGGTGFLGRYVISALKKDAFYTPVIISRDEHHNTEKEVRVTDYSVDSLKDVMSDIDAVIHLAAKRGTGLGVSEYLPNITITENIFKSCVDLGINNIVFASSIAVYSDVSTIPWTEEVTQPKTVYAATKLFCENLGDIYHSKFGLNVKSLRIAQVLGEGEVKGMMNTFIDNTFDKRQLKVMGKSVAQREFVYVKDVAKAFLSALQHSETHGSFNVGINAAYSNLEIAEIVNEVFDNVGNLAYDDSEEETIESSLMDSTKAMDILGYNPQWAFSKALEDIKPIKEKERRV